MDQVPPDSVTAIVFRSVRSSSERSAARRLLADSGIPSVAPRSGDCVLYGLWDLATRTGQGLVGVAATQPPDAGGSVELCGVAIRGDLRHRGLGLRLVTEVADALRAEGATRLGVRLESDHGPAAALLTRAGFAATTDADGRSAGTGAVWRYLAL